MSSFLPAGEGEASIPRELTSGLSFNRTVSPPSSASSKSRSVRDTLFAASRPAPSRDATGRRPPRKDDGGGMGERVAVLVWRNNDARSNSSLKSLQSLQTQSKEAVARRQMEVDIVTGEGTAAE